MGAPWNMDGGMYCKNDQWLVWMEDARICYEKGFNVINFLCHKML